jgi:hemerythrin
MALEWTKSLAVGIETIDAQHQELFRRAAAFLEGAEAGRSRQDVGILLGFLRSYAVTHFGEEEELMRRANYPDYVAHKAQHDRFLRDLLALSRRQEKRQGPGVPPGDLADWVSRWLKEHVSRTDAEMAGFLLVRRAKAQLAAHPRHP